MTPRQRAGRLLESVGDGPPFQIAMLSIAVVRGISYTSGFLPATVAEQALPHWLLIMCLSGLAVGAATSLSAVLRVNLELELRGLTLLGSQSLLYSLVLLYEKPHLAFLNFYIYFVLALACWGRWRRIRRLSRTLIPTTGGTE